MEHGLIDIKTLSTFSGMVMFVSVATSFIKEPIKKRWGDWVIRPVSILIAFLAQLLVLFSGTDPITIQSAGLTFVNSIVVAAAATGTYEFISDPMAKKILPQNLLPGTTIPSPVQLPHSNTPPIKTPGCLPPNGT